MKKKETKASCAEEEFLKRVLLDNYKQNPEYDEDCHKLAEEIRQDLQNQEKE